MHFVVLESIDYCVYGENRHATKGSEIYIPVRSVAKELVRQKRIRPIEPSGLTLADMANPKQEVKLPVDSPALRVGSLIRVDGEDEIFTVSEVLAKQVKVETSPGETKRIAISRIVEVLD